MAKTTGAGGRTLTTEPSGGVHADCAPGAGVGGNEVVGVGDHLDSCVDAGGRDGKGCVHGTVHLAIGAREVYRQMVVYLVDPEADVDGLVLGLPDSENAVAVAEVLVVELAVVEAFELVSDHTFGVVLDALHHLPDEVYAVLLGEGLNSD